MGKHGGFHLTEAICQTKEECWKRMDDLRQYVDDEVEASCAENKEDIRKIFDKIDDLKFWFMGQLVGIILAIIGLIAYMKLG
jgi:hypothetical protein